MSITERLANLSIPTVIITIIVLLVLRWILLKQRYPLAKSIAEIAESLAVAMGLVFLIIRPFFVQAFFIPSESMLPGLRINDHILVNKLVYRFKEPKLGDVVVFKAPLEATPGEEREKDFIKRVIGVPGDLIRITPGYVIIGEAQYSHRDLENMLRGYASADGEAKVKLTHGKALVNGRLVGDSEVAAAAGEPNKKVKVVEGKVWINGKSIREPYTAEDPDRPYPLGGTDPRWIVTVNDVPHVKIPKGKLLVMGDNRNDSNDARYWGLLDRDRILGKAMFIFWPLNRIRWVR